MQIKVSDYIFDYLNCQYGVDKLFMISGGGAMHLNDSVGKNKNITYLCNHHEQASAIGAEAYARITGKTAVVVVTTGPGGTNTITGLIGQWLDSVPVLYLSGQVKYETCKSSCDSLPLRQLGDQEINIVDIVKPITKYASMVINPLDIKYQIDKAMSIANSGRKGPVWLDIPLDVQGAFIETNQLKEFELLQEDLFDKQKVDESIKETIHLLEQAKRPVVIAGNGIRSAGARNAFLELISLLNIPIVTSFLGCDIVPTSHPLYAGRVGTIGNRSGNYAVQNADVLLCIGTRNNVRQTSYNYKSFAREAIKIAVDIDDAELHKPSLKIDIPICCDAKYFIQQMKQLILEKDFSFHQNWVRWNKIRLQKYPAYLSEYDVEKETGVHPYYFVREMTKCLQESDIVVTGNATPSIVYFQLGEVKGYQRVLWNSGCASMGYDLPAAIGAAFALDKEALQKTNIICLAGDGSLQMNIQELQTLKTHQFPIKLFIFDNQSYISIIQTQTNFFEGRLTACNQDSGVGFPDFGKIAAAYGLKVFVIDKHEGIDNKIKQVLNTPGPVVCHLKLQADYRFLPKVASFQKADGTIVSRPLEDMFPFLDRSEFLQNMIVKPLEESIE